MAFLQKTLVGLLASVSEPGTAASCNSATLDTTTYLYPVTVEGTTIANIAAATNRGICDIGRYNAMADVSIAPNVGQSIAIPPQVCEPDSTTCLLPNTTTTRTCVDGGVREYYTVKGDTYGKIAQRLNITVEALTSGEQWLAGSPADQEVDAGQFLDIPMCDPSSCEMHPFVFKNGTFKDLADEYHTTVGQIMMLSPTYNSSPWQYTGGSPPIINIPMNCAATSRKTTILS